MSNAAQTLLNTTSSRKSHRTNHCKETRFRHMKTYPKALILQQMHSGPKWKAYPPKFEKDLLNITENTFVYTN